MTALTIPVELAAIYTALGWRLVYEGCCGLAHVIPPTVPARLSRRSRLWRPAAYQWRRQYQSGTGGA
jgi:hypothetical protein